LARQGKVSLGKARQGNGKTMPYRGRAEQDNEGQGKANQGKVGQVRAMKGKAGQGRAGQARAG
jgi:hypothetical protein